jgi:NADH dehydrogenase [ubiquinone] 1 alpha subcomplex assembly factor 7
MADTEVAARGVTALGRRIARRIALAGPLSVADYMAEVSQHPRHGYYRTKEPLGAAGDFVTAPEVSQMFGELVGLWCAEVWRMLGAPDPVLLVELGPGRGTLLADALRAARLVPAFGQAARVHLVEISLALREQQRAALAGRRDIAWHAGLQDVPSGAMILVANEFFDALPIRQFVRTARGWRERLVGLDEGGGLAWTLSAPLPDAMVAGAQPPDVAPGSVVEVSAQAAALAGEIARRVVASPGAALVIDYGYGHERHGNTLQAVRRHRRHDVLAAPGSADLSAHVDFAALGRAAEAAGATTHGPVAQRTLLRRLGIDARAARLMAARDPAQRAAVAAARERLIAPGQMGTLFKAIAITARDAPVPPGFEPDS